MDDLQRDLFYRGLRVYRRISGHVRVSAQMPLISRMTDSTLLRKPHWDADESMGYRDCFGILIGRELPRQGTAAFSSDACQPTELG